MGGGGGCYHTEVTERERMEYGNAGSERIRRWGFCVLVGKKVGGGEGDLENFLEIARGFCSE